MKNLLLKAEGIPAVPQSAIVALVGRVNSSWYRDNPPGTVMFGGALIERKANHDPLGNLDVSMDVTLQFSVVPGGWNTLINPITGFPVPAGEEDSFYPPADFNEIESMFPGLAEVVPV